MTKPIPEAMRPAFERTAHPFHMWEALESTPAALASVLKESEEAIDKAADAVAAVDCLHLVGCGTSYFAAIAGTYAFHQISGTLAQAHNAFEFAGYPPAGLSRAALAGISHTGGTQVVIDALAVAAGAGAPTVGLTDLPESKLAKAATHVILGGGGPEPALPKTKSYPAALLKLYLLAAATAEARGRDAAEGRAALTAAPELTRRVLRESLPLAEHLGRSRKPGSRIFLFGGGPNLASALEGALKLQEAARVAAHAWELEEGMHGPWVIMEPDDLVIMFAHRGPSRAKATGIVSALKAVGPEIWAITDDPAGVEGADYVSIMPDVPEYFSPLFAALPLYQFTYNVALSRSLRPDCMRFTDSNYLEARLNLPR